MRALRREECADLACVYRVTEAAETTEVDTQKPHARFWTLDLIAFISKVTAASEPHACICLFSSKYGVEWSFAVRWRRRLVQSDDHRERWLITLVTMPVLWPWPPLLNYTGSVNVQVNGACLGDVWNKPVLAGKSSSPHNISLTCSVLPLCHAGAVFHVCPAVIIWWACKVQWVRSGNDGADVRPTSRHWP